MHTIPITVLIVDDEKPARNELKYIIGQHADFQIEGEADSGEDALKLVEKLQPDVIFLDIEMNDINGLEVARQIYQFDNPPAIIFATAYNQHAIKAFEVRAVDYILKPFDDERIAECLARLRILKKDDFSTQQLVDKIKDLLYNDPSQGQTHTTTKQVLTKIPVEHNGRLLLLDPKDIIFVATGSGKHVNIHTRTTVYPATMNLSVIEEKLAHSPQRFFRVQRSYLVNLDEVKELVPWFKGNYMVAMSDTDKTEIPVSRLCSKKLRDELGL